MADYKFFKDREGKSNVGVIYKDSTWIPMDEGNKDYQVYLAWVAAGNTTDPAS